MITSIVFSLSVRKDINYFEIMETLSTCRRLQNAKISVVSNENLDPLLTILEFVCGIMTLFPEKVSHSTTPHYLSDGPRNTTLSTSAPHNVAAPGESVDITCLTKSNPKSSCTLLMKRPDESIHALASSLPGVFVIPSYSTSQHYGAYLCRCSNELSFQDKFLILSTYGKRFRIGYRV